MNIFVTPLEVMNDSLVGQLFLDDKDILEEVYNTFFDIEVVKFSDHCLLIF